MTSVSRHERISGQLVDLKMPGALEALDEVIRRVDSGSLSGSEAIEQLLGAQIALRNNRRLEAAMRSSRLPAVKRLADFDFTFQPSLRREQIDSLHELDFLRRKENVVFLGPPGVGKTHLAISLAIRAAERGRRVYYGSLRDLVGSLQEAETKGQAAPAAGPHPPRAAGGGRDRLPAGDPERGDVVLPAHQRALRAGVHGADFEQGVRGVGDDPRGRGDGGGAAGSAAPPLPHREHPGEQLPDAERGDLAQALRQVPARKNPEQGPYPSGGAPVKRHARRARISGRSAPSVRARRAHPGTHPPPPIRPQPLQIPSTHPSTGTQSPRKSGTPRSGTFSKPIDKRQQELERRSPTGIARERETCTNDAGPSQRESRTTSCRRGERTDPIMWVPAAQPPALHTRTAFQHRRETRAANGSKSWSAGLRPASRGSAKPAPMTPAANSDRRMLRPSEAEIDACSGHPSRK